MWRFVTYKETNTCACIVSTLTACLINTVSYLEIFIKGITKSNLISVSVYTLDTSVNLREYLDLSLIYTLLSALSGEALYSGELLFWRVTISFCTLSKFHMILSEA